MEANSERRKILYITTISGFLPQFENGDVSIVQGMGYEVHYASNFNNPVYEIPKDYFVNEKIHCHPIGITKSPIHFIANIKAIKKLRKLIDEEHIDIIHCHNPMGGVVARLAANASAVKPYVIYTAHGFHFYKGAPLKNWLFFFPVEKALARCTDSIVTINQEDFYNAKKFFHLKPDGIIEIIHGVGIDTEKYASKPDIREQKKAELGIPSNAFHIVTAAELNDNKNHHVVIEAISELDNDKIYYSICGKGKNSGSLQKLIQEKGLEDRVKLLGYRTDMDEVLQTADVFAFPSIREGLGIAAVEALACEVPLIVADNRGTREYAIDGYNSIVCDAHKIEDFSKAIEILSNDKKYQNDLKLNCRKTAEKFSKEHTESVMLTVYARADRNVKEK